MDKVVGIIAEYNPFHNGHIYHLQEAKRKTGANYSVCIMSGNFTQRGDSSIVNKWVKTYMALLNGIDLVIELPTIYSISSAENFAMGGMKILDSLKIIDNVAFGIETDDLEALDNIATSLYQEPKKYTTILSHELQRGLSFPKARENAILMYLNDIKRYANIMNGSNNILAIEYLKAMKKLKTKIVPIGIKREKVDYNDNEIIDGFASATAIRKMFARGNFNDIEQVVPKNVLNILKEEYKRGNYVPDLSRFEKEILYHLRRTTTEKIENLPDVSEGLDKTIKNVSGSCNNLIDLVSMVKSKRFTTTRIRRILLYDLLGISKKDMEMSKKIMPYVRVLGFNQNGRDLISRIKRNNPKIPIITSVKKFTEQNKDKNLKRMLDIDIMATNIYTLGYEYESWANLDYTNNMIII